MKNNKNSLVEAVVGENLEVETVNVAPQAVTGKMNFRAKVIKHLEGYKIDNLHITEEGIYHNNNNGEDLLKGHILPKAKAEYNILEKYRSSYFAYQSIKQMTHHRYFHHLNSSQAMCINFFYPLLVKKRLDVVLSLLGIPGEPMYESACFEKKSLLEGTNTRNTNFDFYMETTEKKKVYFEIKYTEYNFAKNKMDVEHQAKYLRTYDNLVKKSCALAVDTRNEAFFLKNYQVMRNLLHIDADSYIVFVYPEGNKVIGHSAHIAKTEMLNEGWKDHLILLTWEDLLKYAISHTDSKIFGDYFTDDFTKKYII